MIPMMNIIAWGNTVPWAELRQVEQDLIISRAIVDLSPRDPRQAGYHRIDTEPRFLLDHGNRRANVLECGRDGEGVEGGVHVGRPPGPIRERAGQRTLDQFARRRRILGRRPKVLPSARASRQQRR